MNHLSTTSLSALPLRSVLAGAALAAILAGCSTMAEPNPALNQAITAPRRMTARGASSTRRSARGSSS